MAKKPIRKPGESTREYRARVSKWEAKQAGRVVRDTASAVGNFLMSKPKAGEDKNMNLTEWRKNDKSGTSSVTGKKTTPPTRKEGQRATLNGKPVIWKKGKWVPAPSRSWKNPEGAKGGGEGDRSTWKAKEKDPPTQNPNIQQFASGDRRGGDRGGGGDNRQAPTPPRQRKDPPKGRPGQGSAGFRMKADLGKMLKDKPKEAPKKKSRLDDALAWASDKKNKDAWEGKKKK